MPRRNTELLLLGAAAPAVVLVFVLVRLSAGAPFSASDLLVPGGLLLAFALAHLAARRFAPGADPALLPIAALLSGLGIAMISRLDTSGSNLASAQVMWLLGGVAALIATLALVPSLERLGRYKYTMMLLGLVMLLLPAVVGREINGAKLWLRIGGYSFQPAEVAKVLVVLFLAAYLAENREVLSVSTRRVLGVWLPPARHLAPLVVMWAISLVVLVAEKDLGSSLLFFGIFLAMLYVATGRPAYVLAGVVLFALGAVGAYFAFAHVRARVGIWLDPFADAQKTGYQLVQSLFSLAAGGITGTGLGRGLPERIPYVATDFIFSAIGEELGLLGGVAVVTAYLVFCVRGLATAVRARSDMAALTAAGLVASFGLQAFVIVGGVTRLIPLTGITLPFVSYGGSSVLANFILLGLLMRAGDDAPEDGAEIVSTGRTGSLGRVALAGRLTNVAWLVAALMAALVVNLTYLQVVAASALAANPANTRNLERELRAERGAIVTRDGVVLARSVRTGARYTRTYPAGSLASHVVGYYSARYGRFGIEAACNDVLAGHRAFSDIQSAIDEALGRTPPGNDVVLTIDSRVQAAAEKALAGRRGACVVIDPRTGAVLALASSPSYEPATVDADWARLSKGASAPLVDRAIASLYPPGSTFKVVTLTGALANGTAAPSTVYPAPGVLDIGGGKVTNFEGRGYGSSTLEQATVSSINTVFAQVAVQLGAAKLVETARGFGFDKPVPFELSVRPALMPAPGSMTTWETAWAGVGQPVGAGTVKGPVATPLEMALVAAGIAADGTVMQPHLVDRVTDSSGTTLQSNATVKEWTKACDPAVAAMVRDIMVRVVKSGSGTRAAIRGVKVAGKTGTAEVGKSLQTHAWFIAFAPADKPTVAVALVLENAGVGGRVAAPAAKPVLEAALKVQR